MFRHLRRLAMALAAFALAGAGAVPTPKHDVRSAQELFVEDLLERDQPLDIGVDRDGRSVAVGSGREGDGSSRSGFLAPRNPLHDVEDVR